MMKVYTGMKLTEAAPYITMLKNAFNYEEDNYKNIFSGMIIRECRLYSYSVELEFNGIRNGEPLSMTFVMNFRNKKKDYQEIDHIDAEYTSTGNKVTIVVQGNAYHHPKYDELPYYLDIGSTADELIRWLESVNNGFKTGKIRLIDWKHMHKAEFKKYADFVNSLTQEFTYYTYDRTINHFVLPYSKASSHNLLGIEDDQRIYIKFKITIDHYNEDANKAIIDMIASKLDAGSVTNETSYSDYNVIKCYSLDEAEKLIGIVNDCCATYMDKVADEHGFTWRGIEFDEDGPKDKKLIENAKNEYDAKCIDLLKKKIIEKYDYTKAFSEDDCKETVFQYGDLSVKYSKTFTADKYSAKKGWQPGKITYGILGTINTRNIEAVIYKNENLSYYDDKIILVLPLMYRTVDGMYYTFDEAMQNNTMGGPIDVVYKKNEVYYDWICKKRDEKLFDSKINDELVRAWLKSQEEAEKVREKYHDYIYRNINYVDNLLLHYEEQYRKYLEFAKSM